MTGPDRIRRAIDIDRGGDKAPPRPFVVCHNVREVRSIIEAGVDAVLDADFYRCPNTGEWVYKWADERLTLNVPEQ